jgi:hypothetical protein
MGTHVTPPKGGATAVFPPTQLTPHASNPPDMGTNAEPPDGGASTSSGINSPILLSDSPRNLGPSMEAIVFADFTTAQLAATPTTTRVQDEFKTHAATLDNAITFPTPPSTDSFNAMILRALEDISGKFEAINQRLNGMPTTATMTLTIREEFTPRFVALETCITTTNKRLYSMATTMAAMLCNEFDPKFADLNKCVGKTAELLMAKIDGWGSHIGHITKTAIPRVKDNVQKALFEAYDTKISSIPDLEARVRVLENRLPVDHPSPNRPTPIDTSRVSDVPPAQRDPLPDDDAPILAEPPPANPRVRFDEDHHAIATYTDEHEDYDWYVPESFTTPMTATTARIFAPLIDDIKGNPWLRILWHD